MLPATQNTTHIFLVTGASADVHRALRDCFQYASDRRCLAPGRFAVTYYCEHGGLEAAMECVNVDLLNQYGCELDVIY